MVNNILKKTYLLIVFLLVFSAFTVALEVTPGTIANQLCPRDTGLFTDFITNNAAEPKEYSINTQGAADVWATSVPTGFILGAGEQRALYTYVTPGKAAVPGTYSLDVLITGQGETKTLSHPVTVKSCYGAKLSSNVQSIDICPMATAKYEFSLTNSGEYRDSFDLSVEGQIKDKVSLSDSVVTLDAGQTKKILVYVTAPTSAEKFAFTVVATGQKSSIVESFSATLNVKPCFDFIVEVDKSNFDFCEHTVVEIPIKARNGGTAVNTYDVSIDGPEWAKIDTDFLHLGTRQSETMTLIMAPTYGVSGEFRINLEVIPEKGDLKAVHDFAVNVRKCNAVSVDVVEEKVRMCNGDSGVYETLIQNTGENTKEFEVSLEDSPEWGTFGAGSSRFSLRPQEVKKMLLKIQPSLDVSSGSYDFNVKVTSTDDSAVTAFAEDSIEVETVGVDACYNPSLDVENDDVVVYEDATSTVPITVRNNGMNEGDFNIVVSGTASNFVQLTPSVVSVEPGKSEVIYLYIAPSAQTVLGDYEAVVSVRLKDSDFLDSEEIEIEVTDDLGEVNVGEQVVNKTLSLDKFRSPEVKEKLLNLKNSVVNKKNSFMASKFVEKVKAWKVGILIVIGALILILIYFGFVREGKKEETTEKKES